MSDVFLSYSRRDTKFVREIFELLSSHKREAWIDLHDIDYSVKWWEEICNGIDGADNFVLFVSPNSLESLFCHREIQHAIEHNKRIIPFLIQPIDKQSFFHAWKNNPELSKYEQLAHDNWENIQSIQWIDFTQINDVNSAVETLLQTVDTDPERVKLHTRLLLRLRDWESQGRNPSGLLRGDELLQYERWSAESLQKKTPPHPTEDQATYITQSRLTQDELEAKRIQRERLVRRFRTASITLGLFFVLAIAATAVTIYITNSAVNKANDQVAYGNTQVAIIGQTLTPIPPQLTSVARTIVAGSYMIESLNLSAESNAILRNESGNSETAALLGIRVLRKLYLASADSALIEATNRIKAVPQVFKNQGNVDCVAFSPDGQTFLLGIQTQGQGGSIELRETLTGKIIWSHAGSLPIINSIAYSPDGNLIIAAGSDNTAILLETLSGNIIRKFEGHTEGVQRAVFSPDGKNILTAGGGNDTTVQLWDVNSGELIYTAPSGVGFIALFFFPDGQSFFARDSVYSTSDGHKIPNMGVGGGTLALSPDGKISLKGLNLVAELRDAANGQILRKLTGHTDAVKSASFSNDGKWVVTGSQDNTTRVWEVATGKQLLVLTGTTSMVNAVAISPDMTKVLTGSKDALLWSITDEIQQQIITTKAGITTSSLAPDGKSLLVGDESGNSGLWDLNSGKIIFNFQKDNSDLKTVSYSPDGKLVAIPNSKDVNLYDPTSGELLLTFTGISKQPWINKLAFTSDSKMLFVLYMDNSARLWDVGSGQVLRQFIGTNDPNRQGPGLLSPDGKYAILDGGFSWWDVSSGEKIKIPEEMSGGLITFSNDGSLFAISKNGKAASVMNMSTKQQINSYFGHTDQITSMAISPDNKFLLTGSADKSVRLWDISTGQMLRVFSGHNAAVTGVAFTPDEKRIVTTSLDKTIRTWIIDYNDFLAYACTRVGTDLTEEERKLYGVTGDEPTCPQFGDKSQPLLPTTTPIPTRTQFPLWTPIATPTVNP